MQMYVQLVGAMLLHNFIVQIHIFICVTHANLLQPPQENLKYLQNCIENIEKTYFKPKDFIIFINLNDTLKHLQLNINAVVEQNRHVDYLISFTFFKVDAYVLVGSEDSIISLIKSLMETNYWNPRARFVIILNREPNTLFMILNKYYIFNAIALFSKTTDLMEIYTAYPYDLSLPIEERNEPHLIDEFYKGRFKKRSDLFPNKLPNEWNTFTVRVVLMEHTPYVICSDCEDENKSGIEIRILKFISRVLGFKIRYIEKRFSTWGRLHSDGSYDGAYSYLQNHKADIAIGIFTANYTDSQYFDLAFPYLEDTYRWVVPASKKEPSWRNIVQIFKWSVWMLIITSLFSVSLTLYCVGSHVSELKSYREFLRCFLICLQCLLGQCVHRQPKRVEVRLAFILWAFLSWLISVAFQSHLTTALNFSSYGEQISNVHQLIDSGLQIGFFDLLASLFENRKTKIDMYIYDNFIVCPLDDTCLNKTAFQRNFATVKVKRYLENIIYQHYLDSADRPLLYVFEKELSYLLINMVFSKGFPMYESVNKLMFSLIDTGFVDRNRRREKQFLEEVLGRSKTQNIQADVLDILEMQGIFAMLFLGWLLSLTAFIAEHALRPEKFLNK